MAVVVVSVLCQPASAQQGTKFEGFVDRLADLKAAAAQGPVPVIIRLSLGQTGGGFALEETLSAAGVGAQRAGIGDARRRILGRLGASSRSNLKTYDTLPLVALTLDQADLTRLAVDPEVLDIQLDAISPPTLDSSIPVMGIDSAWSAGYTGAGQTVAILDSGVDNDHPFFGGRVVSEACYSTTSAVAGSTSVCPGGASSSTAPESGENCNLAIFGCNHGTHVAGIAAGNGARFDGVARGASIIAIQVFSRFDGAECFFSGQPSPCVLSFTSDLLRGLERVFALRSSFDIAAANISLGGGQFFRHCDTDFRKVAIDNLRSAGIATTIASGNNGFNGSINAPACISTAIAVGSTTDRDTVSNFSNHATLVDLMAVGSSVNSSVPNNRFSVLNGTSMAAPHVAGAWALMKEAGGNSVSQIEACLESTGGGVTRSGITVPRLQVDSAIGCIAPIPPPPAVAMVVNVGSGLCLSGSGQDGGLFLARCAAGADQRFDPAADGTLRLYGNLCLDKPPQGSAPKKNALVATACDGSAGQAWVVEQKSSNRLTNGNKRCVAVDKNGQAQGDVLIIRNCRGGSQSRQFALIPLGSEVEQCFGSAGSACAKATDLPRTAMGRRGKKGRQKIAVSVGTIAHDNCCRQSPSGYHCQGPASGESETNCKAAWLQAERDLKLGRYWKHKFGPYSAVVYSDDLAAVPGRQLVLPGQTGTGKGDSCDDTVTIARPLETRASLALAAPNGTKLDCTDAAFCASGNARSPAGKDHIVCTR